MQIRYIKSGEVFHVDVSTGRERIAAGLAVEVPSSFVPPKPLQTTWQASEGKFAGIDYQYPPYIYVNCNNCAQRQWVENPKTFAFRHCGTVENIPNTVLAKYEALVRAYKARSKKQPPLTVDAAVVDRQVLKTLGIKSRDELLQEHMRLNEIGRSKKG